MRSKHSRGKINDGVAFSLVIGIDAAELGGHLTQWAVVQQLSLQWLREAEANIFAIPPRRSLFVF
jgi:hypothetical protein